MTQSTSVDNIIPLKWRPPFSAKHTLETDPLLVVEKTTIVDGLFSLLEETPGLATITNVTGRILYMNERGRRMLGTQSDGLNDRGNFSACFSSESARELQARAIPLAMRNGTWRGEATLADRAGTHIPVSQVIIFQRGSTCDGGYLLSIAWDMSKQKGIERELRYKATHDHLTGLPNRALLDDRLEHALHAANRSQQVVGVVFMDINGFKEINDRYGHEDANEVLKVVATRISDSMRSVDTVVRYGGDEFVLVLPGLQGPDKIDPILDRVRDALSEPIRLGRRCLVIGASAGVAVYPRDGHEPNILLQLADEHMYRDKHRRNATRTKLSGRESAGPPDDGNVSEIAQSGV